MDRMTNVTNLAELIGCNRLTVLSWIRDGMPATKEQGGPRGAYVIDTTEAIRWIVKHYQSRARTSARDAKAEVTGNARERKAAADAELKEMALARAKGEVVDVAEVEARWAQHGHALREAMHALPGMAVQDGMLAAADEPRLEDMVRAAFESFVRKQGGTE